MDLNFDKNLKTVDDLGNNNGISVVKEVLIEERRKKVLKQKT